MEPSNRRAVKRWLGGSAIFALRWIGMGGSGTLDLQLRGHLPVMRRYFEQLISARAIDGGDREPQ